MEQMKGSPIGIDLGTAYTRVAVYNGSFNRMIPDEQGNIAMPSYVSFTDSGVLVGEAARQQIWQNPTNTIFDIIRLIGRRYSDPSVRKDERLWPFMVSASPDDKLLVDVRINGKLTQFTPVEICSMILIKTKEKVEKNLGSLVTDAVITVPVCFNYEQRQAIYQAGAIAGLNFLQIISVPAASALFYGMERLSKPKLPSNPISGITNAARGFLMRESHEHHMVIFDLGAGTLDVAVVTIKENVCRVQATAGDIHFGGSDFDKKMVVHFVKGLKDSGQGSISNIPAAMTKLRMFCEKAKVALCSGTKTVPMQIIPLHENINLDSSITETKFHVLNMDHFKNCINTIGRCLQDAKLSSRVDEVILAGGSTRIPLLQSKISDYFKGTAVTTSQNLEIATAYGAAIQAFSVSTWMNGRGCYFSLHDATPLSLSLQSEHGEIVVHVPKNTSIPTQIEKTYHSYTPNKKYFIFEVYEGGEGQNNTKILLGKFDLSVTRFPSIGCDFDICFEVHGNGAVKVTAEESFSRIRNGITITHSGIDDSKKRVCEALVHNELEASTLKAYKGKCLTSSSTSGKCDQMREKQTLGELLKRDKEQTEMDMGQASRYSVEPEEYAIGIDFGTIFSSVAVWQRNGVKVIENEYGNRLTSSVVAFTDNCRLIGDTVHKDQVAMNPANTVANIKRFLGKCYSDQSGQNDNNLVPFRVFCGEKNRAMVLVKYKNEDKPFASEEIAAMILTKMKEIAETHLNSKVSKAVISVPSSFSDSQRKAIKDAAVIAGLDVLQLLNEPTATAIAYFMQKFSGQSFAEKKMLIFDLGGGHLNVSIVILNDHNIRVQAVAGDTDLGGEDFDNNMVSYFVQKFMKDNERDIHNKPRSLRRLKAACEKAKRALSTNAQTMVEIDSLDEGIDFHDVLSRNVFEQLNDDLFRKSISCVERCLEDAELDKACIDEVILVGGSSRIPKIQQLLQEFFNGKELCKNVINADEAVVYGAAVQAAILSGNEDREKFNILKLQDVTSVSFGMGNKDESIVNMLIPKHTPIPAKRELIFSTCSDNLSRFLVEVQECELASKMVFTLSNIVPTPRGTQIYLSFDVDNNGILNLTAKDTRTGHKNVVVISKENGGLTKEEIQKMVEAGARYKAEDDEYKLSAEALNSLENTAIKVKAMARDSCMSAEDKEVMEKTADATITWLEKNPHAGIGEINDQKMHLETIKGKH